MFDDSWLEEAYEDRYMEDNSDFVRDWAEEEYWRNYNPEED